jgi:hypothetical protein
MATKYTDMDSLEQGIQGWWGRKIWVVEVEANADMVERFLNDLDDFIAARAGTNAAHPLHAWRDVRPLTDKKGNFLYALTVP